MRSRIIVSIPLVWGIRNHILSGLTSRLEEDFEVYYAIPAIGKVYFIGNGTSEEGLLLLESQRSTVFQRWFNIVVRSAHRRRFPTRSDEVFKPILPAAKGRVRNALLSIASGLFSNSFLFGLLEKVERWLFVRRIDADLRQRIAAINPAFALSTSYVVDTEWSLFRLLHEMKIPIATHILSFDNLTSRGYLPIKYFDKFLVWNDRMADELNHIYSIPRANIVITGTPQFDFHNAKPFVRSREWTESKLGIGQGPYILYCANHYALTPDEPQLVAKIVGELMRNKDLASVQLVLRLHPMDDYERWNEINSCFPNIKVSYPWSHQDQSDTYWGQPSLEDIILFSNTLRYCSVVLNIASSVSIDAAILDRPVVCVGFSSDRANKYNSLYRDYHYSHHYQPIMETGATPIGLDLGQLVEQIMDALSAPNKLSQNRKQLVSLLCGEMDGSSTERIVAFVRKYNGVVQHGKTEYDR